MRQWMINLPDKDLAYLPQGTEHFEDYVRCSALAAGLRDLVDVVHTLRQVFCVKG
jgi:hypothetical protein